MTVCSSGLLSPKIRTLTLYQTFVYHHTLTSDLAPTPYAGGVLIEGGSEGGNEEVGGTKRGGGRGRKEEDKEDISKEGGKEGRKEEEREGAS